MQKSLGKGPNDGTMIWAWVDGARQNLASRAKRVGDQHRQSASGCVAQILTRAEDDGIPLDPKLNPKKLCLREKMHFWDKRTGFTKTDGVVA